MHISTPFSSCSFLTPFECIFPRKLLPVLEISDKVNKDFNPLAFIFFAKQCVTDEEREKGREEVKMKGKRIYVFVREGETEGERETKE